MNGIVFDIRRFSIHDGDGIRSSVYLKGCPLRCQWCQNPEGQDGRPTLWHFPSKCIECGDCVAACPRGALSSRDKAAAPKGPKPDAGGFIRIDRARCDECGACVEACPTASLGFVGRPMSVEEVLDEVLADAVFYDVSGGGLTLSGGDPVAQPDFSLALLRAAKARGLATAIESCLYLSTATLLDFLPVTDLFLADLKAVDPVLHQRGTGFDNALILRNLWELADAGARMKVRLPLIPGHTATRENVEAVAAFVRSLRGDIELELLNFNPLARDKYRIAGLTYALDGVSTRFSEEEMRRFRSWAGLS